MAEVQKISCPRARLTGLVYLAFFSAAIIGTLCQHGTLVASDAAATARNLIAHEFMFRLGACLGLVSIALYIALTTLLYRLLKPAGKTLALMALLFSLAGCAVQAMGTVFQLAPYLVLPGASNSSVLAAEPAPAAALLFLQMYIQTVYVALFFFGCFMVLLGILIFRSEFLPRWIGVLITVAGIGWLTSSWPPLAAHLAVVVQPLGVLAEGALLLWLLFAGVNAARWNERARNAGLR